ncbi:hypothetical protein BC831DRAFT_458450 [Entophlyctis helioformis]|nr:hypothetical protein BC831DRAFT_458450 [Entophlyctis helioformis]
MRWAFENLVNDGDSVTALTVVKKPVDNISPLDDGDMALTMLQGLTRKLQASTGINARIHCSVVGGDAREAILETAEEVQATMIAMGSRGRSQIAGMLMGSVSDYITHHSDLPVTIVKC